MASAIAQMAYGRIDRFARVIRDRLHEPQPAHHEPRAQLAGSERAAQGGLRWRTARPVPSVPQHSRSTAYTVSSRGRASNCGR